jgi:hypothetical protein
MRVSSEDERFHEYGPLTPPFILSSAGSTPHQPVLGRLTYQRTYPVVRCVFFLSCLLGYSLCGSAFLEVLGFDYRPQLLKVEGRAPSLFGSRLVEISDKLLTLHTAGPTAFNGPSTSHTQVKNRWSRFTPFHSSQHPHVLTRANSSR